MAQTSVKAFGRAEIPNVIASAFLIKGGVGGDFSRCWRKAISAAASATLLLFLQRTESEV